jgi:NTP pyrophosphatase (non-canonical NTP hydrolase)
MTAVLEEFVDFDLDRYQEFVDDMTTFDGLQREELAWATIGLTSEAGEVAGEVEKLLRKGEDIEARRDKIFDELGDVLWYCGAICNTMGFSLEDVLDHNINKLNKRHNEVSQ